MGKTKTNNSIFHFFIISISLFSFLGYCSFSCNDLYNILFTEEKDIDIPPSAISSMSSGFPTSPTTHVDELSGGVDNTMPSPEMEEGRPFRFE